MKTLQERLRKSSGDFRLLCLEAANHIDTLEAEVARLRQVIAQAGDNIELQEAEQRGFLRGQATPLSAQEDVRARAKQIIFDWSGDILGSTVVERHCDDLVERLSGLLSDRERGLEEAGKLLLFQDEWAAVLRSRFEALCLEPGKQRLEYVTIANLAREAVGYFQSEIIRSLKRSQEKG